MLRRMTDASGSGAVSPEVASTTCLASRVGVRPLETNARRRRQASDTNVAGWKHLS